MTELDQSPVERKRLWLCLEPVDTLFFRDGRPFDPASRATSNLPNPQVLAGALRTKLLRRANIDLARLADCIRNGDQFETAASQVGGSLGELIAKASFRGPYLGRRDDTAKRDMLYYPAPVTLRRSIKEGAGGKVVRLDPLCADLSLPGWKPKAEGMAPLWTRARDILKPLDKTWITHEGMSTFLSGKIPLPGDLVSPDELYGFEDRTGIAIDPTVGTAQEGMIYATRRLVLQPGIRFWAQVEGSADVLGLLPKQNEYTLLPFGGEGRQVSMTGCDPENNPLNASPEPTPKSIQGKCLVLVTPAFLNGWKPPGLALLAAAVPGHVPVSGWDLARGGPKPTRFAVKPGSVYFLHPSSDRLPVSGLGDVHDTSLGWGEYCEGVWHHAYNL